MKSKALLNAIATGLIICFLVASVNGQNSVLSLIKNHSADGQDVATTLHFYDNKDAVTRFREVDLSDNIKSLFTIETEDLIVLNLFNDVEYTAEVLRVEEIMEDNVTITAKLLSYDFAHIIISTTENRTLGIIRIPEEGIVFHITSDPAGMRHFLIEMNSSQMKKPVLYPPVIATEFSEDEIQEQIRIKEEIESKSTGPWDPATIDVMVVYTPAARTWGNTNGGGIRNLIAIAMATSQVVLTNSNTLVTMRLVHNSEVTYTESGSSQTDLDRLRITNDGHMDIVHTWRNTYGADLVQLYTTLNGGIGNLITNINGEPARAFSISGVSYATDYVPIHEMGHNMGCHHHKQQSHQPGPTIWSNWPGNIWSAGWRWTGNNSGRYCSVMTYPEGVWFPDGLDHEWVPYFSTPLINYFGVPAGHSNDGDNSRTIRGVKHSLAAYRSTATINCIECPGYDLAINPGNSWATHSSSIAASGCKMYRISVEQGRTYTFKTGCGNGATASFDTYLEIFNNNCAQVAYNDDGCAPNLSIVSWMANYTGYAYVKVRGYGGASGNYTMAYQRTDELTWQGTISTNWNSAGNWDGNVIPDNSFNVIIPTGAVRQPYVSSANASCKNLILNSGATLTIGGYTLNVGENLTVHGSIAMNNSTGLLNVSGNIVWESGSSANMTAAAFIYVYGNWNFNAGSNANLTNGFVDFRGASDCWIRSYGTNNSSFNNLRIYKTGGAAAKFSNASTANLVVNNLTFISSTSKLDSYSNYNIEMKGNFNYYGTFDFTLNGNTGSVVFNGGTQSINKFDAGSGVFNNVIFSSTNNTTIGNGDITIAKNLTINQGSFISNGFTVTLGGNWTNNAFPSGFNAGTGRVIFNGTGHQYVNSNENFNTLEANMGAALRINNAARTVTCAQYHWTSGGIDVIAGTFTAGDLAQNGIYGGFWLGTSNATINLINSTGITWVDLRGQIYNYGGTLNITGTIADWPFANGAHLEMSGGVIDFKTCGLTIYDSYTWTHNITGGTIRTSRGYNGNRADFTPTAGTFEFYGSGDYNISQSNGSTVHHVKIIKAAKEGGENNINGPVYDERSGVLITDGGKANTISLASNFVVTGDLTVEAGSFNLGSSTCTVNGTTTVFGQLIMNNAANDLTTGYMLWDDGSSANVTAGTFHAGTWFFKEGTTAKLGTGNTTYITSVMNFPTSNDAEFGNLVRGPLSKNANGEKAGKALYPTKVMGYYTVKSGASLNFWEPGAGMIVAGNATIENGASISFSAADFQVGGTLNLSGALFVSNGRSATVQGELTFPSGGWLSLNNASFFNNYNVVSGLTTLSGRLTMNSGSLVEFPGRSISLGVPFVNEISGGTIRFGRTFNSTVAGTFQQNTGTIEFISTNSGHYINLTNGNFANNVVINKPSGTLSLTADLTLNGNLTIDAGVLNSNNLTIQIAGNWTNNVGTTGFTEGEGTVIFNGPNQAKINTAETFYNMTVNKTYGGWDGLEIMSVPVTVLNNLDIVDGTLEVNSNSVLTIGNNVSIADAAGLNVGVLDFDIEVYIGGNYTNNNLFYDTFQGYTPGGETVTFNGAGDQYIYTVAAQEDFNNFRVDKPSGSLRPNGNLQILGDFEVVSGSFFRQTTGLTHSFHGDFTVGANGVYNPGNPSITVFKGLHDQDYYRSPGGSGQFNSIVVDKTAAKLFIPPTVEGGEKPIAPQNNGKSKGMTVNLLSGVVAFNNGTTTIENGTLNLNGNSFKSVGNYNINSGGVLNASPGSSISIVDGLFVNDGGVLELFGTAANNVIVHKDVVGLYQFEVNSGGTIRASYTNFSDMNANGIQINPGAVVDATHSFHHCTFRLGAPAPSTLLTIDNNQTFTANHTVFPANTWGGQYNVTKNVNQGHVTFYNATGSFAGENFDNDFSNRIDWFEPTLTANPLTQTVTPPASTTTFNITSNMTWTVTESTGWFSVAPMGGSNNGIITVTYDRNTSASSRSGNITISAPDVADVILSVVQEGVALSLNPLVRDVNAGAGTVGFSLTSNAAWTIAESIPWFSISPMNGTGNSMLAVSYDENTSLSPRSGQFTISSTGVPDIVATVNQAGVLIPVNQLVSGTVLPGDYECYDASQTITVQNYVVENGASVNLVAGQDIIMLPGTHAKNGSYFHAWISDVDHCGIIPTPTFLAGNEEIIATAVNDAVMPLTSQFFRVYPNPTSGLFTLELADADETASITVEIYSMLGEILLHTELLASGHYQFDLSGRQAGMYLIRVRKGNMVGFEKMLKY